MKQGSKHVRWQYTKTTNLRRAVLNKYLGNRFEKVRMSEEGRLILGAEGSILFTDKSRIHLYEFIAENLGLKMFGVAEWAQSGIRFLDGSYSETDDVTRFVEEYLQKEQHKRLCESNDLSCEFYGQIEVAGKGDQASMGQFVLRPVFISAISKASVRAVQIAFAVSRVRAVESCLSMTVTNHKCHLLDKLATIQPDLLRHTPNRVPDDCARKVVEILQEGIDRSQEIAEEYVALLEQRKNDLHLVTGTDYGSAAQQDATRFRNGSVIRVAFFGVTSFAAAGLFLFTHLFPSLVLLSAWLLAILILTGGLCLEHFTGILLLRWLLNEYRRGRLLQVEELKLFKYLDAAASHREVSNRFEKLLAWLAEQVGVRRTGKEGSTPANLF